MPIWKALTLLPSILNGTHSDNQQVSMWKSKHVTVETIKPFVLHADGEIIEDNAFKVKIQIAEKGINVIVPNNNIFV